MMNLNHSIDYVEANMLLRYAMSKPISVEEWMNLSSDELSDGSWNLMMRRVAEFHDKHDFENQLNNGHDMGYRVALTVEELGEFSAAITKGKPVEQVGEELADLLILLLGHSLALKIDLAKFFDDKVEKIMKRESILGRLGIRVTEYKQDL